MNQLPMSTGFLLRVLSELEDGTNMFTETLGFLLNTGRHMPLTVASNSKRRQVAL
jgi:hypothetical protein